jgi:hypothetical protein
MRRSRSHRPPPPTRNPSADESELDSSLREELLVRLTERGDAVQARGLKRLVALLDGAEGPERQQSAACEAALALRLLARGARIQFEVPTPSGRTADFLVGLRVRPVHTSADGEFALHVKRWSPRTDRETETLRVPAALRALERVRRPYLVGVRWPSQRADYERFLREGMLFLQQASVGDEWVCRGELGHPCGGLRLLAPWPGDRIVLTVGLDATLDAEIARVMRLLRKAHAQFLSDVPNVIALVGGSSADERLVDTAVFGSHVERWDLFPPRGHRVAHGRGDDGFWSGERFVHARAIAWFPWSQRRGLGGARVWFRTRQDANATIRSLLR